MHLTKEKDYATKPALMGRSGVGPMTNSDGKELVIPNLFLENGHSPSLI